MSPNGSSAPNPSIHIVQHPTANEEHAVPSLYGLPLKYVSLVTLAVQNAALTIIMHTSRISTSPSHQYSASSAVLLNELLKGSISFAIAFARIDEPPVQTPFTPRRAPGFYLHSSPSSFSQYPSRCRRIAREIFSADCWKLSIPAILYVIQNNLQYVAASNLDAATFQVTYQMKILTTAAFSVLLLRRQLSSTKWLSLFFLALGVGIVQIQSRGGGKPAPASPDAVGHVMNPLLGFLAVTAACFTSGLAGVYFEMVLKNSQADLWVRNVQLSLFSLVPALLPALLSSSDAGTGFFGGLFRNFGFWAWATVLTQVFGGLITAVVIKHADNILKGFATSLSIVISFIASVLLFKFAVTPGFLLGACVVLGATWMYNQPTPSKDSDSSADMDMGQERKGLGLSVKLSRSSRPNSALGSPVESTAPILGQTPSPGPSDKKRAALPSARAIAAALGLPYSKADDAHEHEYEPITHPLYSPSATPPSTRPPSPLPPPPPSPRAGSRPSSRLAVPSAVSTPYSLSRAGSSSDLMEQK